MAPDLQGLRLGFKKAFAQYYLALRSPGIADPTQAFATAYDYLAQLRGQLGEHEFLRRLDDETTRLAGEVEQDLRQRARRGTATMLELDPAMSDDLEDRLRECFEYALDRLMEYGAEEEAD
jgi:hypothetical protein